MFDYEHTQHFENVLIAAKREALDAGAEAVTPAHLFIGLMHSGAGFSSVVLQGMNISATSARSAMHKHFGLYPKKVESEEVGMSMNSMRALDTAKKIAGPETLCPHHLLISLLVQSSNQNTELSFVLRDLGFTPNGVLENVQHVLSEKFEEYMMSRKPEAKHTTKHKKHQTSSSPHPLPRCLSTFGKDLTALAEAGKLDPVVGRDSEVYRAIRTLLRRRKSNPCFVGKAGVGKSAIAEGLAQRIAEGNVPEALRGCRIVEINSGSLLSGTKYRGDFEERVTKIIKEVSENTNIILFFDEMHTLLDGNSLDSSGMSASNILKPALARGDVRTMGATTLEEYRKYIEKDPALERRFQKIVIEEPTVEQTVEILSNLRKRYEEHHGITIEDDAIKAAVKLSERYIYDRQLPDKAIDILDETASLVQLSGGTQMAEQDVASVISELTGIPVGNISETESKRLLSLEKRLHTRVVGQHEAVVATANAIRRNRAGLKDTHRPIGSFLFLGPTGVGKTELSLALSETLYQQKKSLIRLDMSEYMESASVSKLLGAAPGYIGFDSHEALTEKIAQKPHSVVLFDEIEKAHPDVWNILLQILDAGTLVSSSGREVSFKNAVVIVTSNIGANHLVTPTRSLGFSQSTEQESAQSKVLDDLKRMLKPELLNRFDEIIVFDKLTLNDASAITQKMANEVAEKALAAGLVLTFTDEVIDVLAEKGYDPLYGARPIRRVIQKEVEDKLANMMLDSQVTTGDCIECGFDGKIRFTVKSEAKV